MLHTSFIDNFVIVSNTTQAIPFYLIMQNLNDENYDISIKFHERNTFYEFIAYRFFFKISITASFEISS